MATKSLVSSTVSLTLKQKADLIRAQRQQHVPAERRDVSFSESLGFMAGDFINGFGNVSDAYTVRRAERS